MYRGRFAAVGLFIVLVAVALTVFQPWQGPAPTGGNATVVASGLSVPWAISFLPDGDMLVTERPGSLLRIDRSGGETTVYEVDGVAHRGEGGLLGVALHPNFTRNSYIYLYMTTRQGDMLQNRVVRYRLDGT